MRSFLRYIFICIFLLTGASSSQAQDSFNLTLLGHWDNDSLTKIGEQSFNEIWGYYDSVKQREYAIMGSLDSVYFIDITNPANPLVVDVEPGRSRGAINRDIQTYKHYCYAIADQGSASLQIFDLRTLPDSVNKVYDSNVLSITCHTLHVDNDRLYMAANRRLDFVTGAFKKSPLEVFSLQNPEVPQLIATYTHAMFGNHNVHDAFVRNDTAYCSSENAGLYIYNMKNVTNPIPISIIANYPENGYNHSSMISEDGRALLFADEVPGGLGLKLFDISDIYEPELTSVFRSHQGATPHNPYIKGKYAYISYYHDGLYIFDISDISNPSLAGFYDTYPEVNSGYSGYQGNWGVYPFLPSGNIIASDMKNGLFVFKQSATFGSKEIYSGKKIQVFPNPVQPGQTINFQYPELISGSSLVSLYDMKGELIMNIEMKDSKRSMELPASISAGTYILRVSNGNQSMRSTLSVVR